MRLIKNIITKEFKNPHRTNGKSLSKSKFRKPYLAEELWFDGYRTTTIERENCIGIHVLFFHGGAYACDATPIHRWMVKRLVDDGFRVTFFDYPMIPEHTASFTNQWVSQSYQGLTLKHPHDTYVIFGDSAGGGLSLIFRMLVRDQNMKPVPQKMAIASPWLDLSMCNPNIIESSKIDMILPLDGLVWVGEKYADELGVKHPLVSPIFGNLNDLGDILMFYSSKEIFLPDCEKLLKLVEKAEQTTLLAEKCDGLFHDYLMAINTKESKNAFRRITSFYKQM
jgi:epsilon-lactone hydrolase